MFKIEIDVGQMKTKRVLRTFVILMILSVNIGCDQISKTIVRQKLDYNEQIGLVNNYLTITKVENSGAFLSLGDSLSEPVRIILLIVIPIIVIGIAFIYLLLKYNLSNLTTLGICLIIGGGIGNMFDRVIYGTVTDFLHIDFIIFQTGVFNIADFSIMIGVFIVLIETYIKKQRSQKIKNTI